MTLQPSSSIQKGIVSTPTFFVGEYESADVLLTHAWPNFTDHSALRRWEEGPASRSAYIFSWLTEPHETGLGTKLPDHFPCLDIATSYLSLLFGKRFDSHGLIQGAGLYHIPDLSHYGILVNPKLPTNSRKPRVDWMIPLDLSEVSRIAPLLSDDCHDTAFIRTFQGAARFYSRALQSYEQDPEIAYLHLISVGEMLSGFTKFQKSELLDDTSRQYLQNIRKDLDNGPKIAAHFEGKLLFVKKRFVETLRRLIKPGFFDRTEAAMQGRFQPETFNRVIGAAYDLRSKYVHEGIEFGSLASFRIGGEETEVILVKNNAILADKALSKIFDCAPTLHGLERIMRCCLLSFAAQHGAFAQPGKDAGGA
jgi:hypothetical protein